MKRILVITTIAIISVFGIYTYLIWNSNGNPRYIQHRYNKVITEPLAKMGNTDTQYKMGLYFCAVGEREVSKEEFEKAIYWWNKAADKGNKKAIKALAEARKI